MACLLATPARLSAGASGEVLEPELTGDEAYTETYTIVADFGAGGYLQAQLAVTNAGVGSGRGACRLLFAGADGPARTATRVLKRRDWRSERTPVPRLSMGPCSISSPVAGLALAAAINDFSIALQTHAAPKAVRPPGSRIPPEGGSGAFYESEILIPWADAEAQLSLGGRASTLRGRAYVDHSRTTALPVKVAAGWLRFRALDRRCPVLLLARLPPGAAAPVAWMWSGADVAPVTLPLASLALPEPDKATGLLQLDAGETRLTITPERLLFRYEPVKELGLVGKAIGAWAGNVLTATYRATLTAGSACGPTAGILEITRVR